MIKTRFLLETSDVLFKPRKTVTTEVPKLLKFFVARKKKKKKDELRPFHSYKKQKERLQNNKNRERKKKIQIIVTK